MLKLIDTFSNLPVLSLRTGGPVARITQPIIEPTKLKVVGFYVEDIFSKEILVLRSEDIREQLAIGVAVNDHDVLTPPEDLLRLQEILELNFSPFEKLVVTKKGRRLGKITNYSVEHKSLYIQRLFYSQPLWHVLGGEKSFRREHIIEITNRKFVIKDPEEKVKSAARVKPALNRSSALKRLSGTPQPQGAISTSND